MLYLLLGNEDFLKKEFVANLAKQKSFEIEYLPEDFNPTLLKDALAPNLFGKNKIFIVSNFVTKLSEEDINFVSASSQFLIIIESKLDKRKTQNQALLKNKNINVKEFSTPSGQELNEWITNRVKDLGAEISNKATILLASRFMEEGNGFAFKNAELKYNLWQVENELQKLLIFGGGKKITEEAVSLLTPNLSEAEGWDIVNALAEKDVKKTYQLTEKFFTGRTTEEKAKAIMLNAILADQFRNILLVQNFIADRVTEVDILQMTGWKSGRLFVLKKLAGKFSPLKVKEFCKKLVSLDEQLKSSSTPSRVLLDLITSQILL